MRLLREGVIKDYTQRLLHRGGGFEQVVLFAIFSHESIYTYIFIYFLKSHRNLFFNLWSPPSLPQAYPSIRKHQAEDS